MMWRVISFIFLVSAPVFAVEPDEILTDPLLESRAREISKELRCLVCRNENIDSSNAGIAKDLRVLVRERLVAGDSDQQVFDYVVDRYGEFVLLKPPMNLKNIVLWLVGPLFLGIGFLVAVRFIKKNKHANDSKLSDAELKRVQELLDE